MRKKFAATRTVKLVRLTLVTILIAMVAFGLARSIHTARANASTPSWWNGNCDVNNHPGSYPLGASYNGVIACGPGTTQGGTDYTVHFYPGAWGESEWECVELVMRYMYLVYGIKPYRANGSTVVSNYNGTILTKVSNNGANLPSLGDVISEGATTTNGHTAVVTAVSVRNGTGTITVMQQNATANGWGTILVKGNVLGSSVTGWLHNSGSANGGPPSTPVAVSRSSSDMAVFYNDGNGHLVNWSWNANTGWSVQQWNATFNGDPINGQPAVISRTSDSMDVFYRTKSGKLVNMGWNATNGWSGPTILLSSGVAGDPAVVTRDSADMQVFFLTSTGQIESIYWNASTGWNTSLQILYTSSATNDPVAVSRSSDSMEVFFGKNNGNLVHLVWSSENGWRTEDFSAGAGVTGKPSCIVRNSGNDMSCYYQENGNGKVAEEFWNINNGWGWQDWTASLAGVPSAIPGISHTIDDFYRETGGNIVDRYFSSCGWCTMNIVAAGGATGNPFALVRGSNIEVFYWDGSVLMDAHWDTTTNSWSTAPV